MAAIVISLARMGDAPHIANMSRTLIESGLPWSWTPRRVAAHMREREHVTVVAKVGGELVGFAMAQFGSDSVHLALIGVAEGYRRGSVGRRLVAWIEESAVVAGLFEIRLEVRSVNQPARRFYAALGYKESGTAPGYYSGMEDAIRFSRDLRMVSCPP